MPSLPPSTGTGSSEDDVASLTTGSSQTGDPREEDTGPSIARARTVASDGSEAVDDGPPMEICLVVYGDINATSGGFRYDREVVSRLRERGDSVDVISLPWRSYGRGLADTLDPRVRERLNRDVDVLIEDGLCHPSVWRHNRQLTEPDVVVGLVHHVRSDDPTERYAPLIQPFERRFFGSVDATITTSRFTQNRVAQIAPSTATDLSVVAPPAGRMEGPATTVERVRARARRGPLRVVFVGNVVPRKNLETLIDALSRLDRSTEAGVDWRATVVGSLDAAPSYADRLRTRTERLGLDDRVEFAGELSDDALASTMAESHVCCVPARYEAFGMVHLEAMEHGTVPIAGSVGGTDEFLRDGTNGFLVDPEDHRSIAERLERLAADRDQLAALGVAALHTAEAHPDWAETTDRIRAWLRSLVGDEQTDPQRTAATGAHHSTTDVSRPVRPRRATDGTGGGNE